MQLLHNLITIIGLKKYLKNDNFENNLSKQKKIDISFFIIWRYVSYL